MFLAQVPASRSRARRRWLQRRRRGSSTGGSDLRSATWIASGAPSRAPSNGVGTGPIPANHLDPRMCSEPGGEGLRRPVGDYIDRPMCVHVQHKPYTCPRSSAKSSTPRTRGPRTGCSGSTRTGRSNVIRDTTTAIPAASRAPTRPAGRGQNCREECPLRMNRRLLLRRSPSWS